MGYNNSAIVGVQQPKEIKTSMQFMLIIVPNN